MDEGSRSFIRSDYREGLAARCGNVLGVFLSAAREWAAGRSATLRLLLWGYFVYAFVRHLGDPLYKSLFGALNLGVHELGHVIFSPFGQFLSIAAGSFVQCLVPGVSFFMFYRQRDFFAVSVSFTWLAVNLFEVASYAADAVKMDLPLVSPFAGQPIHDWNFLLDRTGLLGRTASVAFGFRLAGILFMLAGLLFGGWLLFEMIRSRRPAP